MDKDKMINNQSYAMTYYNRNIDQFYRRINEYLIYQWIQWVAKFSNLMMIIIFMSMIYQKEVMTAQVPLYISINQFKTVIIFIYIQLSMDVLIQLQMYKKTEQIE